MTRNLLNRFRRKLTSKMTKGLMISQLTADGPLLAENVRDILLVRPNHRLGNLILVSALIQELEQLFPAAKIDLLGKGGLASVLYQNYDSVRRIYQLPRWPFKKPLEYLSVYWKLKTASYDLVMNLVPGSSSGRIFTNISPSRMKVPDVCGNLPRNSPEDFRHMAKQPVYRLRHYFQRRQGEPVPCLDLRLSEDELKRGKNLLHQMVDIAKPSIGLFTHATAKKCYSEAWWGEFYKQLRARFPGHNIVEVLPIENISRLNRKVPAFYSRDIRELAGFIANLSVLVAADSGIMHLASAAQTPTIGLFSVTDPQMYMPYNPGSIAVDTNQTAIQEIVELMYQRSQVPGESTLNFP